MKQRPLPKTVTPLADELLSGWLTRLAVTNHCEVDELLAHIGVDTRHAAMLDFDVEVAASTAEKISIAARVAAKNCSISCRWGNDPNRSPDDGAVLIDKKAAAANPKVLCVGAGD